VLTAADIEGRLLVPLTELFGRDPAPVDPEAVDGSVGDLLDRVLCADSSLQAVENGLRGRVVVVLDTEIALKPFGDTASVVIGGGGGFTVLEALAALERTADGLRFDVTLREVPVALRVPASVLRPLVPGTLEPDLSATHLDIPLGAVTLSVGTDRPFELDVVAAPALPLCMIGDTGIVSAWARSGGSRPPATTCPPRPRRSSPASTSTTRCSRWPGWSSRATPC